MGSEPTERPSAEKIADPPAIEDMIPHRPPFLFLDEIRALYEDRVVASRRIRGDEPHFQGHYPGRPLMPGVLLCEAALQAGAYLVGCRLLGHPESGVPVVTRMNQVKFRRMVLPGDVIELEVRWLKETLGAHFLTATIRKEARVACSLEFVVMWAEQDAAP